MIYNRSSLNFFLPPYNFEEYANYEVEYKSLKKKYQTRLPGT